MKLVYVSGSYRAPTMHGVVENIRRAESWAIQVWRAGAACLCPHLNTALLDGVCPDDVWLQGDFEMLKRCDALLMIAGWELSQGATAEHALAKELELPIFYDCNQLRDWLAMED